MIKKIIEQVQQQASTDPLTGLLNRRAFLELVAREQTRAARYNLPTTFLMVDIDHFKRINDVYGHPAGDAVLRGVARSFAGSTRTTDIICRWGGEEFVVALPHTDGDDALVAADRIRQRIEQATHDIPGGGSLSVTASIGLSTGVVGTWTVDEMLAAADEALYEAKHTGRNRVCSQAHLKRLAGAAEEHNLRRAS